jgi:hypothetical protein
MTATKTTTTTKRADALKLLKAYQKQTKPTVDWATKQQEIAEKVGASSGWVWRLARDEFGADGVKELRDTRSKAALRS